MLRIVIAASLLLSALPASAAPIKAEFRSERIAAEVSGSGPDVVLIPGLGSSPRIWDTTVLRVPGYRYHVIQVAGFDGVPAGANAAGPLLARVADEIARYVREARLRKPAVVGHSFGGMLGMMLAARHADAAGRLMVVDMLPFLTPMIAGPGATLESVRPFAEQSRQQIAAATDAEGKKKIAEMVVGSTRYARDRSASLAYWLASDPRVTSQGMYEMFTSDLRPEIPKIRVPLTVLWVAPERSPLTAAQAAELYKISFAGAPHARIKRIPDSHHLIMLDQPAAFRSELRAFLEGD